MSAISYIPAPHERPYYEGLFQTADIQKSGNIAGGPAVQFFSRSKLPIDVLKNIWTVADQPSTSSLDRKKFAVAIRLIQLTQNGRKGDGPNLQVPAGVNLRPAMFEGVSGVTVQLPPAAAAPGPAGQQPPQQQQQYQQQPPPQQQQQQQQQPPPQQMQQQQQQQQAPPTPVQQNRPSMQQQRPGAGMPPPTPGGSSRALVGQDPYAMSPQERARYESLFPQYAKPDGFIYGKEAVGLFLKSGVDQTMLRDIWNMVDRPIDNRLDKLEFALAMHLIVCISKKGLQLPKSVLPNSLQALKVTQTPAGQQRPSVVPQQQVGAPPQSPVPQAQPQPPMQSSARIPSPTPQRQYMNPSMSPQRQYQQVAQPPPQQQAQYGQQIPAPPMTTNPSLSPQRQYQQVAQPPPQQQAQYGQQIPAPPMTTNPSMSPPQQASMSPSRAVPPIVGTSGMSISDAFEGLSTTSGDVHQPTTLPSYVPDQKTATRDYHATPAVPEEPVVAAPAAPTPAPMPTQHMQSTPKISASSYDMGDSNEELVKLKGVLQKLQAENISLKAQLGTMTDEEKDVQKEIGATVAEVSRLSNELATLRGQVLAAKSRLLEASSQLKLAREKKSALTDQISEAKSTKDAINEAYNAVENSAASAHQAEHHAAEQQKNRAVQQSDFFESNLFGDGGGGGAFAPAPSPMSNFQQPHAVQHTLSHDSLDSNPISASGGSIASGSHSLMTNQSTLPPPPLPVPPPAQQAPAGMPIVQTVSSDEAEEAAPPQGRPSAGGELFSNEFEPPAPAPSNPQQDGSNGLPPPQQFQQSQPPPAQSQPVAASPKRPGNLATHHRQASGGFASDFVMGGAAMPFNNEPEEQTGVQGVSPAARTYSDSSAYGYDDDEAYKNVEEMKKKAETAQETARDAESAHRKLVTEADELRQDADKAEATARSLRAAADEKKKGTFGGGKKKKLMKDADKAAGDASEIKKRFLAVQGQAIDAQAVAMATKREADKLRDEAEKAELEMAAQASVKEQEKKAAAEQEKAAAAAPAAPPTPNANGHGGQEYLQQQQQYGYGQPTAPPGGQPYPPAGNGYGQYPPPQQQYGYGAPAPYGGAMAPPSAYGFAPGVMGGADGDNKGFDLPSPNQMQMPQPSQPSNDYANPFD